MSNQLTHDIFTTFNEINSACELKHQFINLWAPNQLVESGLASFATSDCVKDMRENVMHQNNFHYVKVESHSRSETFLKTWRMNERACPLLLEHHRMNDEIACVPITKNVHAANQPKLKKNINVSDT